MRLASIEVKEHAICGSALRGVDGGGVRELPMALLIETEIVDDAIHENLRSTLVAIDADHAADLGVDALVRMVVSGPTDEIADAQPASLASVHFDLRGCARLPEDVAPGLVEDH